jgi:Ca2+-binding EF-hand superfamily protein
MAKTVIGLSVGVCVIALSAGLLAQMPPRDGGRGFGMPPNVLFAALDKNNDGVLSADEIDAAPASLRTLDRNGDGRLTEDELRPGFGRGGPGGRGGRDDEDPRAAPSDVSGEMVKMLMAFDSNGDGKLSKDELPERFRACSTAATRTRTAF